MYTLRRLCISKKRRRRLPSSLKPLKNPPWVRKASRTPAGVHYTWLQSTVYRGEGTRPSIGILEITSLLHTQNLSFPSLPFSAQLLRHGLLPTPPPPLDAFCKFAYGPSVKGKPSNDVGYRTPASRFSSCVQARSSLDRRPSTKTTTSHEKKKKKRASSRSSSEREEASNGPPRRRRTQVWCVCVCVSGEGNQVIGLSATHTEEPAERKRRGKRERARKWRTTGGG